MKAQQARTATVVALTLGGFWNLAHAGAASPAPASPAPASPAPANSAPGGPAENADLPAPSRSDSSDAGNLETVVVTGFSASLERSLA